MPTRYFLLSLILGVCITWLAVSAKAETTAVSNSYFVSSQDVANAVGSALVKRGVAEKVQASLLVSQPILQTSSTPLSVAIKGLDYNDNSKTWNAQMVVMAKNETLSVSPIEGRYESIITVPVLNRQVNHKDVIAESDISMKEIIERRTNKDTATRKEQLIGKSVIRAISANRPIRLSEIRTPVLVNKGQTVEITYSTPFMTLRTMGQALEDGAQGSLIRIKNNDTERAISARVTSIDRVEANLQHAVIN